jgi:hypothetical protein
VPEDDRTYYPGIYIDWDFDVQIPNQSQTYNFTLTSDPAQHISYDSVSNEEYDPNKDFAEVLSADKGNIYNSMASSAFDDFKANLVFKMGIGTEPKTVDETTPNTETTPSVTKEKPKTGKSSNNKSVEF